MVTFKDFTQAMKVVIAFLEQNGKKQEEVVQEDKRIKLSDFLVDAKYRMQTRTYNGLYAASIENSFGNRQFTYLDEVDKDSFLTVRNLGKGGLAEFLKLKEKYIEGKIY